MKMTRVNRPYLIPLHRIRTVTPQINRIRWDFACTRTLVLTLVISRCEIRSRIGAPIGGPPLAQRALAFRSEMQSSEIARRRLEASELESRSLKESLAAKVPSSFPSSVPEFLFTNSVRVHNI